MHPVCSPAVVSLRLSGKTFAKKEICADLGDMGDDSCTDKAQQEDSAD